MIRRGTPPLCRSRLMGLYFPFGAHISPARWMYISSSVDLYIQQSNCIFAKKRLLLLDGDTPNILKKTNGWNKYSLKPVCL